MAVIIDTPPAPISATAGLDVADFPAPAVDADLREFDIILVSSSAGKDSQAMLDYVAERAAAAGVSDRVVVVHADLGRVEWQGTAELAEEQAAAYGFPFHKVSRPQGDLLEHVEKRGKWMSSAARFCTSDHKRGQIGKVITALVKAERERNGGQHVRVLECLGFRAEESPARAKREQLTVNKRASNGKRTVTTWLPILAYTTDHVWARIRQSGVAHHPAYDLGMPRLSCVFCVMAPKSALVLAGQHNPELLDEYVAVEERIGHTFRVGLSMADVKAAVQAGEVDSVSDWTM